LENVLEAAVNAGVDRMITVGTDLEDWDLYGELAKSYRGKIDYTVGIHPCSVDESWELASRKIADFWTREKVPVALGEIGLDRFHLPKDESDAERVFNLQLDAFRAQLEISKKLSVPVVVHSRGAFMECVQVIDDSGMDWTRVVFHCFSEGPGEMKQLMDRGAFGSFTGIITFKNAELIRDAAKLQGLGRLMIETDAPYLAPMPHRGKPNEPAYLGHTADFCTEIFGTTPSELARVTTENAVRFYALS
jgi:TatD DNase family protein